MVELNESNPYIQNAFKQNAFRDSIHYRLPRVNDSRDHELDFWIGSMKTDSYMCKFLGKPAANYSQPTVASQTPEIINFPSLLSVFCAPDFLPFSNNSRLPKAIRETNSRTWRCFWHLKTPISYYSLLDITTSEAARRINPSIPLGQQPPQ